MARTLTTEFMDQIKLAMSLTKTPKVVTEDNVYQLAEEQILPCLDYMVEHLILSGSGVDGMENLVSLFEKAKAGASCLLLPEHYSNLDLSIISYLVRREKGGEEIAKNIVAIAGMKLTEDSPAVAAFASAYSRLVIYPSRSLASLDAEKDRAEIIRSNAINRAAMKALIRIKTSGKLILVFPSGTRYRPWEPSTKRGVREIDSYIRSFDYMCCAAINGQILHVQRAEGADMIEDTVTDDVVRVSFGPVHSCAEFREKARAACPEEEDKKQAAVDAIMAELEAMHTAGERR